MLIIWGTGRSAKKVAEAKFQCPHCNDKVRCELHESRRYFTFFFIPLIALTNPEKYVECVRCGNTYAPDVLGAKAAQWPKPSSSISIGCWLLLGMVTLPVLFFGLIFTAAFYFDKHADDGDLRTIKSINGLVEISAPPSWIGGGNMTGFNLENKSGDGFLIVATQKKEEGPGAPSMDDVAKGVANDVTSGRDQRIGGTGGIDSIALVKISGFPAMQHSIRGQMQTRKGRPLFSCRVIVVDTKDSFYVIKAWVVDAENRMPAVERMIESIKITDVKPPQYRQLRRQWRGSLVTAYNIT